MYMYVYLNLFTESSLTESTFLLTPVPLPRPDLEKNVAWSCGRIDTGLANHLCVV